MSDDWLNIFSQEELEQIESRAERIQEDMETMYEITFIVPREQAIDLCRHYAEMHITADPSVEALIFLASLLSSLVGTIETALDGDGIDPYEE